MQLDKSTGGYGSLVCTPSLWRDLGEARGGVAESACPAPLGMGDTGQGSFHAPLPSQLQFLGCRDRVWIIG